jgi:hypothetical protein
MRELYPDLYSEIEDMLLKRKAQDAIYMTGTIENEVHDTTYIVKHDTISSGFEHMFSFNNEFRTLEGNISYMNDSLNFRIDKDIVDFKYAIVQDNKGKIYVKSDNPYVKYNEITGFQVKPIKKKRFHIGPQVSIGYDGSVHPYVGIGITYSLFGF